MTGRVPVPSKKSIRKHLARWEAEEKYTLPVGALSLLFADLCPQNTDMESVLLKVCALNDLFSTSIYDTYTVSKHILSLDIDERLRAHDHQLVNDIAKVSINGKTRKFYSFATKYCSHHEPDAYPIFDSFVGRMLRHYRRTDKFEKFQNDDLKNYPRFIEIIESLRDFYGVTEYSLRELDKFLWLVGKDNFPTKRPTKKGRAN